MRSRVGGVEGLFLGNNIKSFLVRGLFCVYVERFCIMSEEFWFIGK